MLVLPKVLPGGFEEWLYEDPGSVKGVEVEFADEEEKPVSWRTLDEDEVFDVSVLEGEILGRGHGRRVPAGKGVYLEALLLH